MLQKRFTTWMTLVICSTLPVLALAQAAQQNRILVVTGHSGELPLVEIGGRSYIEIESLTRFVNGSLSFSGNQVVLTLPSSSSSLPATSAATNPPPAPGFSKDFLRAGIEQMSVIREWRSTLISAVQQGFPITENWMKGFNDRAQYNLRLVSVAASTESDRNALQLLTKELNNMKRLSDRFVDANKSQTYVAPDALDNDPLDKKILSCGHSLASMAASNQFMDDGSCQ